VTYLGWIILVVGALAVGAVAQWLFKADMPYRWVITAIATFVGAIAASEWLFADWTPEIEGIAVWPAIVGGLVVGVVVDFIAQYYAGQGHGTQGHGVAVH
jgi:uncharacterized membrane protein YeaQ/YmgE (transglycosylase-associated protein family)